MAATWCECGGWHVTLLALLVFAMLCTCGFGLACLSPSNTHVDCAVHLDMLRSCMRTTVDAAQTVNTCKSLLLSFTP